MASLREYLALVSSFTGNRENRSRLQAWRYALRFWLFHRQLMDRIDSFFSANPFRQQVMALPDFREDIYKQQLRNCFYRHSKATDRFELLISHFSLLERLHNNEILIGMYDQTIAPFRLEANGKICACKISYHHDVIREGYLWLTLEMDGQILLKIIFWLMEYEGEPSLCISAIQGGKNTLEANRTFTKVFWGLRPQNMGMQCLRWYANALGIRQLLSVNINNIWSKKIKDREAVADFLQEQGAQPISGSVYTKLSTETARKSLEDVPSKKRSLYRNRFAFLDEASSLAITHFREYR